MKIWLFVLCFTLSAQAADWPRWRGVMGDGAWNPEGIPADFASQQPKELWQVEIGSGYGGVTVSGGRVYVLDRPKEPADIERILCYAEASGKLLWSYTWPAVYGRMQYASGPRSSVNLDEGRAYVLGAAGMALCLDSMSGKVVWQVDTVKEHAAKIPTWGFAASPVLDGGRVLLHVGAQPDGSVLALDKTTGRLLWRGGADPAGYCTPEIINHEGIRQIIAWGPENIQSLNPETGETLWTYPYKITYGVSIAQPLYQDGILLVSGYWHGTKALRLTAQPTLLWENEKDMCGLMSSPLYKEGMVYLLDKNKGLQAFELATGKIRWSDDNRLTPKDRNPQMSLVWLRESQGLAALLNASGELVYVRLQPEGFEELARHQMIGKTWAHPAFVGNKIYARSDTALVAWRLWGED
ncbi:PQQ-binding-like beta-propeller repeat protein [Prosthecobacter fusiformis]|nr:PQQ-binding-like beta-propeller repeat protein [Prosthecobacter fusiformis]